jgi:phosphonate transport system substrate-binding protein
MKHFFIYGTILIIVFAKLTFAPLFRGGSQELGSQNNPIKIMLTPSVEANKVTTSADSLVSYLHKSTGLYFTASVPSSFIVVVESFGSGGVDFAITNTFSYVLAHESYGATAEMMVLRRNGEKTYRGQIITHANSGITSLSQLNNKRFAYVDAASTSGYVLPKALLTKNNITPSEIVYGGKHDNVVNMVYQQQVDAGATYYSAPDSKTGEILDARIRVKTQYPDVFDKVKIVELTDEIPNDPLVFRKNFPDDLKLRIIRAMMEFQATPIGKKVLYETYSIEGLTPVKDSDYDKLRDMISRYGGDLRSILSKKKK